MSADPRRTRLWLSVLVLVCGASSLATEMTGARLLAPYFGTSDLVWANVIGLILLSLSLGYWAGGRMADRHPTTRALASVVLVAACALAVIPFAARPLFSSSAHAFADVSAGAFVASFFGALAMFIVPVTALGAVTPWAVRLAVADVGTAGAVAGRLYALSTIGSIAGTFLPVLVLIPAVGTRRTILGVAAVLALAAAPALRRLPLVVPAVAVGLVLLPPGQIKAAPDGETVVFEGESSYQYVQVLQKPDGARVLQLNEGWAVHSRTPAHGVLTDNYWDAFATLPPLAGGASGRLLVLGNAGGTIARLYGALWPGVSVDGVEIDPLVTRAARRYLDMSNPRLRVYTADARFWLEGSRPSYDIVAIDAYAQPYIPFHLATREFFRLVRDHLRPGGVVAVNVGTPPDQREMVDRIAATMRSEFPTVMTSRVARFNSVVLAFSSPTGAAAARAVLRAQGGALAAPAERLAGDLAEVAPGGTVLTDDHAPVELLTDRALLEYLKDGAPGAP
ncbi:MAG: fused MFS/spermidine synthase [Thermoleophilia bacterium]|nr:fused MFS/spermidine synthase [Thermoleophilia bacterium]